MRISLGLLIAFVFANTAFAADMSVPPPTAYKGPTVIKIDPFAGWFIGLEAGYAWSHANPDLNGIPNLSQNGFTGGGSLSYRSQINPGWYLGLATAFDFVGGSDSKTAGGATITGKNRWAGATMVQLGYNILPDLLFYGEGGIGYGSGRAQIRAGGFNASDTERSAGWAAGAGIDYNLARFGLTNWLATIEYRHIDLGKVNYGFNAGGGLTIGTKVKSDIDQLMAGVKVKFGT